MGSLPALRPHINHLFQLFNSGGYALPPHLLILEFSNSCNLRCKMCWWDFDRKETGPVLTLAEIKRLIDQIQSFRPNITITGAEPFIRQDAADVLHYIRECRLKVSSILTNGTLINENNAAAIVAAGVELVQISIDGDEPTHEKVRGVKGSYRKAIRGIRLIQAASKNSSSPRPAVRLNCVISPENIHCLASLVDLAHELKVQLQFQHLMWLDGDTVDKHTRFLDKRLGCRDDTVRNLQNDLHGLDLDLLEETLALVIAKCEERKVPLKLLQFSDMPTIKKWYTDLSFVPGRRCFEPFFVSRINANGEVKFCPFIDYSYGNIRTESFASLWNNARAKKIRLDLKEEQLFPGCIRCCKL